MTAIVALKMATWICLLSGYSSFNISITTLITCRAKLLNADWLRQRAFFLNQERTFGNQEGMIT